MADCLFCRIAAGEIPAKIAKRTADAIAFHDIDPKAPVHVLVMPTRHLAAVRDAAGADGEAMLGGLLQFAADVAGGEMVPGAPEPHISEDDEFGDVP